MRVVTLFRMVTLPEPTDSGRRGWRINQWPVAYSLWPVFRLLTSAAGSPWRNSRAFLFLGFCHSECQAMNPLFPVAYGLWPVA